MLRATLRSLLQRKLRLLLSAMSIVLGVSFVAGAFVMTDTLGKSFDSLFDTVSADTAVVVRGEQTTSSLEAGTARRDVPDAALTAVAGLEGVDDVQGSITGTAIVVGEDGEALTSASSTPMGVSFHDGPTSILEIRDGRAPSGDGEILVSASTAERAGYAVGDEVPVLTDGPAASFELVGIAGYPGGRDSLAGETLVAFTEPTARRLLDQRTGYDLLEVAAEDGVTQADLRDRVQAALPDGAEALTGSAYAAEQAGEVKESLAFFNTFLLVFALVALFVGSFIIFNTFSMLVAQRQRELALLRAIGATASQVRRAVMVEALAVGFLASGVGLLAGIGVAEGLQALFGAFGVSLPSGSTVVAPRTIVVSFLVGTLVTLFAALMPARRASRISPMAALRDSVTPDRSLARQSVVGAVVLVAGLAAIAAGLDGSPLWALGVGTLLAFLGIAALSPLLARPLAGSFARLFAGSLPGRLGRENTLRNPRRTAVTASALMVGLALMSGVAVLGSSLKTSVEDVTAAAVGSEFLLASQTGFADDVLEGAGAVPGVDRVTGIKADAAKAPFNSALDVLALPSAAVGTSLRLDEVSGDVSGISAGSIVVSEGTAEADGLAPGDSVSLTFADGTEKTLEVQGVYADNALAGSALVDESLARHFTSDRNYGAFVDLAEGAALPEVRDGLDTAIDAYPTVAVQDQSEFAEATGQQVNQIVSMLYLLLAMSVVVAVLGVVNTLALSVLERTRELGLLRAVGMSRRQIKSMVRVEAVVICVFGGVLGVAVGTAMGMTLQRALSGQGVTALSIPVGQLLVFLVLVALAGVLSAILPARRAARLDVLKAIMAD